MTQERQIWDPQRCSAAGSLHPWPAWCRLVADPLDEEALGEGGPLLLSHPPFALPPFRAAAGVELPQPHGVLCAVGSRTRQPAGHTV